MPSAAEELKTYMEKVLATSDLSPEQREAVLAAAAKDADTVFVPRSQYQSDLDKQRNQFAQKEQRYKQWYEEENEKLQNFYKQHGNPTDARAVPGNPNLVTTATGNVITREELEDVVKGMSKRMEDQGMAMVGIMEHSLTMADDYRQRFGERLPIDKVRALAMEEGLPLNLAYERYIAPKVKEQSEKELEKRLREAKEEGIREGMTRATNPAAGETMKDHPLYAKREYPEGVDPKKVTPEQLQQISMDKFVADWEKTNGFQK